MQPSDSHTFAGSGATEGSQESRRGPPGGRTARSATTDPASPARRRGTGTARRGALVTAVSIVVAFAGGDLAMAGVATGAQLLVPTIAGQWLASAAVDALGAYLLFGLPQIRSWEADKRPTPSTDDFRTRWSLALLREDRWLKFVLASLIGGPLAVGLASGYSSHANGRRRTLISAVILGVVWSAFYLGLVSRIVG